ncbi:hypothetical protein Lal_00017381 [Lupinus albus]|nr:hypothetical protein Lal_00017381 [Lupinus albus]
MVNCTTIVMKRVLEFYKSFEHINKLVDVGGGLGINLNIITFKYPHLHGINFDLPHIIEHAHTYAGVEHVGGDMFESVPHGDAIFMKVSFSFSLNKKCILWTNIVGGYFTIGLMSTT